VDGLYTVPAGAGELFCDKLPTDSRLQHRSDQMDQIDRDATVVSLAVPSTIVLP